IPPPPPVISRNNSKLLDLHSAFAFKFLFAALVLLLLPAGPVFAATFNVANNNQLSAAWSAIKSNGEADILNITASFTVSVDLEFTDRDPNTLTINGNGYTLTVPAGPEVLTVYPGRTLYLNNITFTGQKRAVYIEGTAIIDRLTVHNMYHGLWLAPGSKAIVTNSVFRDNDRTQEGNLPGGAIIVDGGDLEVRNSRFINNTALRGGAIFAGSAVNYPVLTHHANIKLYNNTFTGNRDTQTTRGIHYDPTTQTSTEHTPNDFGDGLGAVVVVGGLRIEPNRWKRFDVPSSSLDMRGNTISGNNFDCFVSDFVTITPQSFGANTIGRNSNPTCLRLHRRPSVKQAAAGDGLVYIPPTATPSATATPGISSCLTLPGIVTYNITESTQCQRLDAVGIGNAEIAASGFADAVNVWSWILPGTKICFEAEGSAFKFIDTTALPRVVYDLPATNENGLTCGIIDRPGNLILLPGARPPAAQMQTTAPQETTLSGCMVRTQYILNFRASPGGDVIRAVPYNVTLTAVARTADWFKVDFHGVKGWISADFVEQIGTCG
ncbi:MAG: SH3 domain-containing protein, partial [Chloroflexi bacterium]|nr:SH3 domain-containing protein [Chloroflexota bacterium]